MKRLNSSAGTKVYATRLGKMECNCFLVQTPFLNYVVDAGAQSDELNAKIRELGSGIDFIFATHCHFDHVGGVASLIETFGVPCFLMHELEQKNLSRCKSFSFLLENRKFHPIPSSVIQHFNHSDRLFDGIRFVDFRGHSIGSTGLLDERHGLLFIGDACFKDYNFGGKSEIDYVTEHKKVILDKFSNKYVYQGHGNFIMSSPREG